MKNLIILFLIILTASCSTKKIEQKELATSEVQFLKKELKDTISPSNADTNDPKTFEMNPPVSSVLHSSLIMFEQGYQRLYSDSDIVDFASDDKVVAILTKTQVVLNLAECSSMMLTAPATSISLFDNYVIAYDRSYITVYSLADCSKAGAYTRVLTKSAVIVKDKVVEYEATRVAVRNLFTGEIVVAVDTNINIIKAMLFKDRLSLIHNNGYITYLDEKLKTFLLDIAIPIAFKEANGYKDLVVAVDVEGSLFRFSENGVENSSFSGCKLSHNSLAALCNGELIYNNKNYSRVDTGSAFMAGANIYAVYSQGKTSIFRLKKMFQKYVVFDYKLPKPCLTPKGNLYYASLSGRVIGVIKNEQHYFEKMPTVCDQKRASIRKGKLYCGEKVCGDFADKVNSNGRVELYKRIEDGKLYYYFSE